MILPDNTKTQTTKQVVVSNWKISDPVLQPVQIMQTLHILCKNASSSLTLLSCKSFSPVSPLLFHVSSSVSLSPCPCCVVAVGASWFVALCWLWLRVTSDLSGSMEFHTWCVCDPLTSSCALILLAERLPVPYSKVPPVRIKRSEVETRGNEAMEYGLPFTARPQYHHSVRTVVHMRGRKRMSDGRI